MQQLHAACVLLPVSSIQHAVVLSLFEPCAAADVCCLCSDCGTLGNLVAKLPSPSPEDDERVLKILLLLRDVAEGLKALHEAGVVHGDLVSATNHQPQNDK
jgi:serine/threonine protein kinase